MQNGDKACENTRRVVYIIKKHFFFFLHVDSFTARKYLLVYKQKVSLQVSFQVSLDHTTFFKESGCNRRQQKDFLLAWFMDFPVSIIQFQYPSADNHNAQLTDVLRQILTSFYQAFCLIIVSALKKMFVLYFICFRNIILSFFDGL